MLRGGFFLVEPVDFLQLDLDWVGLEVVHRAGSGVNRGADESADKSVWRYRPELDWSRYCDKATLAKRDRKLVIYRWTPFVDLAIRGLEWVSRG
ncbi:hypothetical protein Thiowin_01958 [Thiorhodovibrio winogradskyi]|uniref:Uncharacterized protein n=1 Tax=Thiorhodovibrio winogradskyi TaxID=77007 RepID=A0ABZ0SAB0_9GAMM